MIASFGDKTSEDIFNGISSKNARKFPNTLLSAACRKLDLINAARTLDDLKAPPQNRLKALKGDLRGYYGIRVNDQFRIIFKMIQSNAHDVTIIDYH
jgi:proteic killer suppression protein